MTAKSNKKTLTCWSCNGTGIAATFLTPKRTVGRLTCDRCQGTGQCPEIMREWEKLGRELKADRLQTRTPLRDRAKAMGVTASQLSKAERGITDPRLLG